MIRFVFILILAFLPVAASADSCPGNPQALGTERVMEVNARVNPRVGRKHFPSTLPLNAKELVLTFDDGPWPGTTSKVLDALKAECVRATFFLLGRNAAAHPQLARRALAEGHTLGHHSYSHPLLSRMALPRAEADIERGIAADETAIYGNRRLGPAQKPAFTLTTRLTLFTRITLRWTFISGRRYSIRFVIPGFRKVFLTLARS